jgi:hypothetical protein
MFDLHTSPHGVSPSKPAVDRRAWVRYSCDLEASCIPANDDPEILWPARVVNISCGGVGLLLSRRFEPGFLLQVELQIPHKGFSRPLLVQVLHATGHERGGWLLGCSFPQPLTEEEVQQLSGPSR